MMSKNNVMLIISLLSMMCLTHYGEAYPKGVCLCQLDSYLQEVQRKLMDSRTTVYVPPLPEPEVDATEAQNETAGNETSSVNETLTAETDETMTTETANDNETSTNENESTADQPSSDDETTASNEDTETNAENTEEATISLRKKREVSLPGENYGIPSPLKGIVYGGSLELSETYGVNFTSNYESSNCSCVVKGIALLQVCLTSIPYDEEKFSDPTTRDSKEVLNRIVPKIHDILMTETLTKSSYIRLIFKEFSNYENKVQAAFTVYFNEEDDLLAYNVNQAMEVRMRGNLLAGYTTDINPKKKCLLVEDMTPEKVEESTLSNYAYIIGAAAVVLLVLLVAVLCLGKRDAFYLRFW